METNVDSSIVESWSTPNEQWLVDRITTENGTVWRVWDYGVLADQLIGNDALVGWLDHHGLAMADLEPVLESTLRG